MFGGAGHQGRAVPVDGNLLVVSVNPGGTAREDKSGSPWAASPARSAPGWYSETGSRNLTLWNLASDPVNQVNKVLVSEFG